MKKALREILVIPIWDIEQDFRIGSLEKIIQPLDEEIKDMAKWRKNNQQAFHDDHEITYESTNDWWNNQMTGSSDRVLFWVKDNQGKHIGHIGLAKFTKTSCELDNVIRGLKSLPGIMHWAVNSLIDFAFTSLKIKSMYLRTRFDNKHAIRFYEMLDFKLHKQDDPLITMKYDGLYTKIKWEKLN